MNRFGIPSKEGSSGGIGLLVKGPFWQPPSVDGRNPFETMVETRRFVGILRYGI